MAWVHHAVVAGSVVVNVITAVVVTFAFVDVSPQSGIKPTHRPIIKRLVVPFIRLLNCDGFR